MLETLRRNAGGWGIKIAFGIIIVVFVFAFGMGSFTDKKEPVVAYVGGEAISAREFQKAFEDAITAMRRQNPGVSAEELNTPQFKQAILGQLVNTRLLLSAAAKMGITVSQAELRAIISSTRPSTTPRTPLTRPSTGTPWPRTTPLRWVSRPS